jgi:autophagy-related protein 17
LESHAGELAGLLSSLVKHYDLCRTAVKHIEGGGAAMQSLATDIPAGVDIDTSKDSLPPEPITDEERQDLFDVIENDSLEVGDAVMEIRDRLSEMEIQSEHVEAYLSEVIAFNDSMVSAFNVMEEIAAKIPQHMNSAQIYAVRWEEYRLKIGEGMEDLLALKEIYDNFLGAYDEMIIEVARRRKVRSKMESVIKDALAKIGSLSEEDMAEREGFRQDFGEFLPTEIWSGLMNPPAKFEIVQLEKETSHVPHLPKEVIEGARVRRDKRLKSRGQA